MQSPGRCCSSSWATSPAAARPMPEPRRTDIVIAPLTRALLDGVDDGSAGARRRVDLAVLPFFEDERPLQGLAGLVDWRIGGGLSALLRAGFCTGATGEAVLLP